MLCNKQIKLSTIRNWKKQYLKDSDLEYFSDPEICSYYEDIRYNIKMSNEPNSRCSMEPIFSEKEFLVRIFVHVFQEIEKRNINKSVFCNKKKFILPNNYQMVSNLFERGNYKRSEIDKHGEKGKIYYFVKYGEKQWIKDLYYNGNLWIRPAWYYQKNESLNPTQIDQEMEKRFNIHSDHIVIESPKIGCIKPIGNVQRISSLTTDYWLYCLSTVFDIRLFAEYCKEQDNMACIIIKRPPLFLKRIEEAVNKRFPNLILCPGTIKYSNIINSSGLNGGGSEVCFTKDLCFYYEKEFRIVWVPKDGPIKIDVDHLEINIGSCKDFCDLIIPSELDV